ncbi:MAG: helix-turn-helix domain-containing protein [Chloroflexota bacterium]
MRWNEIKNEPCSIARTLSVIGDRWTLLIIRNAFMGTRRFDDFQAQLGVTRHLLTDRLNLLVEEEVMRKVPYQEQPTRYEYRLTKKGVELYPVLMALVKWGDNWMTDEKGVPLEYVNRETGEIIEPVLIDKHTGEPIDPRKVDVKLGPGLHEVLSDSTVRKRWEPLLAKRKQR